MEIDLETAEAESAGAITAGTNAHYAFDVCIAGAGIAGLVLADALSHSGLRIALLEAGGKALEERSQQLYSVEMAGHPHSGASEGRFRTFGGSSTRWGGQLLSYTQDIFKPPSSTGVTGWPLDSADLERFYPRVLEMMGVPAGPFEASPFLDELPGAQSSTDLQVRYSRWAPFNRRSLAPTLGRRCIDSKNVTVFFHANVTRLEKSGDAISQVHATTYGRRTFAFSAKHIILCLGTIECSRLLLLSGIGNQHDQVGRYFHDHLGMHAATLQGAGREAAARLYLPRLHNRSLSTPKVEATERWRSEHGANAVMAHFPIVEAEDSPAATVRALLQVAQRREFAPGLLAKVAKLPAGSLDLARMLYATSVLKRRALSRHAELRLNIDLEQRALADSRITLSEHRDALGLPMARLAWQISAEDQGTLRLFAQTLQQALLARGIGDISLPAALMDNNADLSPLLSDTYHMMGGTRMGERPEHSVVDANLKVHSIQNLHVASCAVFPTGGSSNPTFTMMALTLRLAEKLKGLR